VLEFKVSGIKALGIDRLVVEGRENACTFIVSLIVVKKDCSLNFAT
jgi:hypothetical protein